MIHHRQIRRLAAMTGVLAVSGAPLGGCISGGTRDAGVRIGDVTLDQFEAGTTTEAWVRAVLGERTPFEIEWISVYTFQCRRLERFVHGRVIFVGDSAHVVSPFGARGGNGGIQDVDNLVWKLALVLQGMGIKARSWQGWQIPIATSDAHGSARILDIDGKDLIARFTDNHEVAVIAGFQGIHRDTGRLTTLGRGGSGGTAPAV